MGQASSIHLGRQLIKAIEAGDVDAVMKLVTQHPQLLHYSTFARFGPCHYAAKGSHTEVLQLLLAKADELDQQATLQAGSSSTSSTSTGALHQGHHNKAGSLTTRLVNAPSDRGVTCLMLAAKNGSLDCVRLLLDKGADPWALDNLGHRTALHYAVRTDNAEVVQLLVAAAGSTGPVQFPNRPDTKYVDVRTQTGFTAMHYAAYSGCQKALAVLLSCGANLVLSVLYDCMDVINCPPGTTALHLAAREGNEPVVQQLLKAYMDMWSHQRVPDPRRILDGNNQLPCQLAAARQHRGVAQMLLPSTSLCDLLACGKLDVFGPPSLAAIAAAILRSSLTGDLQALQQQQAEAGVSTEQKQEQEQEPEVVAKCSAHTAGACTETAAAPGLPELSAHDAVCGVCLDARLQVCLAPCGHQLCLECCQHMLGVSSRCGLICPFCRAGVANLRPLTIAGATCGKHEKQHLLLPPQAGLLRSSVDMVMARV